MKKLLFLTFILTHSIVYSQTNADSILIKKIANNVLTNNYCYENLRTLCKKVGARLSGSIQAEKAVRLTYNMFKAIANLDTVYLQECMVPQWVRGNKEVVFATTTNNKKINFQVTSLGNTEGTKSKLLTAPIVMVNNYAQLDSLGEKGIKGKIVFYNYHMNPTYIMTGKAYSETSTYRVQGPSKAARYGAVATMVRSLASNVDEHPHTGVCVYNDSFPKIPALAISTADAEQLQTLLTKQQVKNISIKSNCTLLSKVKSYNVIGEIKGNELPNEYITVGGHLDSWDLAEGAHDDGTGCMQSMEVLRVYTALGIKPKRTIRAVLFMNEENGGAGATAYFDNAKTNNEKHFFALESDAGGFTPRGFGITGSNETLQKLQTFIPLLYPYGVYEIRMGGGGADINKLRALGATLCGLSPDSQRYFSHHHAPNDVFEAVDKRELELGAINMAALIYLVDKYGLVTQ
jgi:carboxypeptidase Q